MTCAVGQVGINNTTAVRNDSFVHSCQSLMPGRERETKLKQEIRTLAFSAANVATRT